MYFSKMCTMIISKIFRRTDADFSSEIGDVLGKQILLFLPEKFISYRKVWRYPNIGSGPQTNFAMIYDFCFSFRLG